MRLTLSQVTAMPYYTVTFKRIPRMTGIMACTAAEAVAKYELELATYPMPDGTPNWQQWGKPSVTCEADGFSFTVSNPDIPLSLARRSTQSGVQGCTATDALTSPNLYTWLGVPVRARLDKGYADREAAHQYWATQWQRAIDNMPIRKGKNGGGKWGGLARVLGYKLYSTGGHYCGHTSVYTNTDRGSAPRDPKIACRLAAFSGPHGKLLIWLALMKLGIAHRYVKPETW